MHSVGNFYFLKTDLNSPFASTHVTTPKFMQVHTSQHSQIWLLLVPYGFIFCSGKTGGRPSGPQRWVGVSSCPARRHLGSFAALWRGLPTCLFGSERLRPLVCVWRCLVVLFSSFYCCHLTVERRTLTFYTNIFLRCYCLKRAHCILCGKLVDVNHSDGPWRPKIKKRQGEWYRRKHTRLEARTVLSQTVVLACSASLCGSYSVKLCMRVKS